MVGARARHFGMQLRQIHEDCMNAQTLLNGA